MNTKERYIWVAALILGGFFFQNQESRMSDLNTLIRTYSMQTQIQDQQISDFALQLHSAEQMEYSRGFENGKTQAGIALVQGGSLYDYADGYHAAVDQISDDVGLEVSQGILVELENLRNMVPRLLGQVEQMAEENSRLESASYQDILLEMVLDGISSELRVEETYLEILDLLLAGEEFSPTDGELTEYPVD